MGNATYIDWVYEIVKSEGKGIDALYSDYIVNLVGTYGLNALLNNKLLEPCGVLSGRQLYALIDKK